MPPVDPFGIILEAFCYQAFTPNFSINDPVSGSVDLSDYQLSFGIYLDTGDDEYWSYSSSPILLQTVFTVSTNSATGQIQATFAFTGADIGQLTPTNANSNRYRWLVLGIPPGATDSNAYQGGPLIVYGTPQFSTTIPTPG
jgi:hypothetical protein